MKRWVIAQLTLIVISGFLAYLTGSYARSADLVPVLSTLQNISAAVFTLTGIWVAYMYPEAISVFTSSDKVSLLKGSENVNRISDLVLIIFTSAFVLVGILVYNVVFLLFIHSELVVAHLHVFKTLAVAFVIYLSLNQLRAVFSIMSKNIMFVERLHSLRTEREVEDDL